MKTRYNISMPSFPKSLLCTLYVMTASINLFGQQATPITEVIRLGQKQELPRVLKSHPKMIDEADVTGLPPLIWAILSEDPEMVDLVLAAGADPNICSKTGFHPLKIAVHRGEVEMINLLFGSGAVMKGMERELHTLAVR